MRSRTWVNEAFRKEWPTGINHAISFSVSVVAGSLVSYYASHNLDSAVAVSSLTVAADALGYWGTLLPQLIYRDRKYLRKNPEEQGGYWKRRAGEYASLMLLKQVSYVLWAVPTQTAGQIGGMDSVLANLVTKAVPSAIFAPFQIPLRYAAKNAADKVGYWVRSFSRRDAA
ncbi:MAG: hypothetical protein V1729_05135 [Candidatus Woesearchaeota archaeon]